jgi:hypothetical protein
MKKITNISDIVDEFNKGVKMFGTYQMQDKGASEVCDLESFLNFIRIKTGKEAGKILVELLNHPKLQDDNRGSRLVEGLISSLDDQDDHWFNDMMDVDKKLEELY